MATAPLIDAAVAVTPALAGVAAGILDNMVEGFCAVGGDWLVTYANRRACEMCGLARGAIVGRPIWDRFPGLREGDGGRLLRRAIEAGAAAEFEAPSPEGERWLLFRVGPIGGGLAGVFWRDITARKRLEENLRASEARFRLFADASLDGMVVHDFQTILDVNPRFAEMFGYAAGELVGEHAAKLAGLLVPEDPPEAAARAEKRDGSLAEVTGIRKDGSRFPVEYAIRETTVDGRRIRIGAARDLSERRRAESALAERDERLRLAIEAGHMTAWERIPGDEIVRVYSGSESLAHPERPLGELRAQLHPDDAPRARAAFEAALAGNGRYSSEYRTRNPDGTWRWVADCGIVHRDDAGRPLRVIGVAQDITERKRAEAELRELSEGLDARVAARTRDLAELNERLRRERVVSELILENTAEGIIVVDRDLRYRVWNAGIERINGRRRGDMMGRAVFEVFPHEVDNPVGLAWRDAVAGCRTELRNRHYFADARGVEVVYDADFNPLYDQAGGIVGAVAIVRDVSERHRIEEQLRQSQKLEAVAQLTGGVAHDFNNLLTAVIGCLDLIAHEAENQRTRRLAATALRSAERGSRLTQQLLAFSRRQALRPVSADLNALLAEIEVLLRRAVGETVEIVVDRTPGPVSCEIDPAQFEAAALNLVLNARDAMPSGGRVILRTRDVAAHDIPADLDLPPGAYIAFAVHDTGSGMPPEVAARAFEPFYTTKDIGKGSGLGLSMVYGFARQSGGGARIDSAPGRGTCVTLYLPRADNAAAVERPDIGDARSRGLGSVLVVEDDDDVRDVSVATLRGVGYRVSVARDGPEALAALRRPDPVDLLFTDFVMPRGLSGLALARLARTIRPGIRILLTTGYASLETAAANEFPMILKPFRPAELTRKVAELIDPGDDGPREDAETGFSCSTGGICEQT